MEKEENQIIVSVIVICYNHEKYIEQAISSVLMQKTDFEYEILIGDDASTDRTPEILMKIQKKYPKIIRVFLRDHNLGATRNAYNLFMKAKGKYLATCEGDDYWCDELKLEKQVSFLESHQEYIGCTHKCCIVDEKGKKKRKQRLRWEYQGKVFSIEQFKGYFLAGQVSTFVRRNIYLNQNMDFSVFYKIHPMIGDRTTALIYLSMGNIYRFSSIMSCYRVVNNSNNLTSIIYNKSFQNYLNEIEYTNKLKKYAKNKLKIDVNFDFYLSELFVSGCLRYIKTRNNKELYLLKKIWQQVEHPFKFILRVPVSLLRKIYYKMYCV